MELQFIEDARLKKGISKKKLCADNVMNTCHYSKIIKSGAGYYTTVKKLCLYLGIKTIQL